MNDLTDKNGLTEAEAIARHRAMNYPKPALTADICVFLRAGEGWKLLLIRRGGHPYLGCWALPGGFADEGETIEQTAARELEEETGLSGLPLELVGVYSAPGRDPRGWTVSVAFAVGVRDACPEATAGDDASEAQWFDIAVENGRAVPRLPEGAALAFDHGRILSEAAERLGLI